MAILGIAIILIITGLLIWILSAGPKLPPETDAVIDEVLSQELPELFTGKTGVVTSDGLDIWYESISPEGQPKGSVLLIISMGGSAIDWPQKFVHELVESGYQVIRYDQRGTGMSDWVANWDRKNPYSLRDMAGDAVAVLDALKVEKVHIFGLSMGGMVAQELAINHPYRVESLTLAMTSGDPADPELPNMSSGYFISLIIKSIPFLKYRIAGGEKNLVKERLAKIIANSGYENLDIKEIAELVIYDLHKRRGINMKAVLQHQKAVSISGSRHEKLKALHIPALVIHGTDDQFFPIEHGKKLVESLPDAKGIWLDGVGHVFPFPKMNEVMKEIIRHFSCHEDGGLTTSDNLGVISPR